MKWLCCKALVPKSSAVKKSRASHFSHDMAKSNPMQKSYLVPIFSPSPLPMEMPFCRYRLILGFATPCCSDRRCGLALSSSKSEQWSLDSQFPLFAVRVSIRRATRTWKWRPLTLACLGSITSFHSSFTV